ncbi:MAG: hypothetical protein ACK5JD_13260, partial [Mangrovibacterium sp.]
MELNDLKQTWNKFSESEADKRRIDENELQRMLKRKTGNLMDRIDRNVRIGFAVVCALVLFSLADTLFLTPNMARETEVPAWIYLIDALNNLFLLGTFVYFWLQYRSVKNNYSNTRDMGQVLRSSVKLLTSYRKLFYWSLVVFLFAIAASSVAGFFANPNFDSAVYFEEQNQNTVVLSFALLIAILLLVFSLFRWGFGRLYGRYIKQLNETLSELDEIE